MFLSKSSHGNNSPPGHGGSRRCFRRASSLNDGLISHRSRSLSPVGRHQHYEAISSAITAHYSPEKGSQLSPEIVTSRRTLSGRRKDTLAITSNSSENEKSIHSSGWAGSWLLTPTMGRFHPRHQGSSSPSRSSSVSPKRLLRKKPVLTVLLHRLEEQLETFCGHLSNPTLANAAKATSLLDSSVATASSSPSTSPGSSPHRKVTPPTSHKVSTSAMALESEWEKYTAPFLLLAGGEALYLECSEHMYNLDGLYQKIAQDFLLVKQTLCDPLTDAAAAKVSKALDALVFFCQRRREFMSIQQQDLFTSVIIQAAPAGPTAPHHKMELFRATCVELQERFATIEGGPAQAMMQAFYVELETWAKLADVVIHLQACRFSETVLAAHKFKRLLQAPPQSPLQHWFHVTLQQVKSIMLFYFDRATSGAIQHYGFDPSKMTPATSVEPEMESLVNDFLRRREGPMAVAIVLDSAASDNYNVDGRIHMSTKSNDEPHLEQWPAVFLRYSSSGMASGSTTSMSQKSRSPSTTSSSSLFARGKLRRNEPKGALRRESSLEVLGKLATAGRSNSRLDERVNLYERDTKAWPWTEWNDLVAHFLEEKQFPASEAMDESIRSYKPEEREEATDVVGDLSPLSSASKSDKTNASWFGEDHSRRRTTNAGCTFHTTRLGRHLWLTLIEKDASDNDSKWNLRISSRGHTDSEKHEFLRELASKLRLSSLFQHKSLGRANRSFRSLSPVDLSEVVKHLSGADEFTETRSRKLLKSLKDAFGLRPQSPMMESLAGSSTSFYRDNVKSKRGSRLIVDISTESAMNLFLGPELRQLFPTY